MVLASALLGERTELGAGRVKILDSWLTSSVRVNGDLTSGARGAWDCNDGCTVALRDLGFGGPILSPDVPAENDPDWDALVVAKLTLLGISADLAVGHNL
jgi:hypothetical protein